MMSNQKRLEEYLVGNDKSYLKSDISNGKVIMLSGKWGSGKTFFWQNKIQTVLNDKDKKIPNHYISLYGKTSIQEIKNEIFLKVFESVDSYEVIEKGKALAKNTVGLATSFFGAISVLGVNLDLSKMTDKPFEKLENVLDDKKLKKTIEYLNSGAIICFDDFERKSKDIDLNDLFGFITQLTLNFDCKVVIILNDDVFEGVEKDVFSRVKEKSVSKFLKYEPSIKELFETIFYERRKDDKKKFKYLELRKYRKIILKTIEETQELNARIYIQVLDNLVEWIKNQDKSNDVLRCLILVNINFILYHTILIRKMKSSTPDYKYEIKKLSYEGVNYIQSNDPLPEDYPLFEEYIVKYKHKITYTGSSENKSGNEGIKLIENNISLFKSFYFANKLDISKNVNDNTFQKINNFIETGIL
jgi:hypothetical protein